MVEKQLPDPGTVGLGRVSKPFAETAAAHAVVSAAEQIGWDIVDSTKFLSKVQHVEYGLSSEIEFAAILRWLGWCSFVHRLNEDVLQDPARSQWNIPDLFAVFGVEDQSCSVLIEVKTTEEPVLKFKKAYLERLQAYSQLMNKPLLVAWRLRSVGFWILFDPQIVPPSGDEFIEVGFELAMKNDLMSLLAGDYFIVPKKGAGMRFEFERTGEKKPTEDGYVAPFNVTDAYLHDAAGVQTQYVPNTILWAILSVVNSSQKETDDGFVQSFVATGGTTRAQMVLRTAVAFSLKEAERIHWKAVGNNLDAVISCESLLSDSQARFGTFMSYIFHFQPNEVPSFLPADWRGRSAKGTA